MTDSTLPEDLTPIPDGDDSRSADAAKEAEQRSPRARQADEERADAKPAGADTEGADTPGAPTSDAPLTDSTDGGLEGGDPGVEE
jgi:hypothetical protein